MRIENGEWRMNVEIWHFPLCGLSVHMVYKDAQCVPFVGGMHTHYHRGDHWSPATNKTVSFIFHSQFRLAKSRLRRLLAGRPLRWVCAPLRDNVANGNISLQTPVQGDFAIEHNLFFPSDRARACRDWLLPPMVALLHACLPVRWWIRFAAAKPRRLKRATGTFLRAGFRIHST